MAEDRIQDQLLLFAGIAWKFIHSNSFLCFLLTSSSLAREMQWSSIEKSLWGRSLQMILRSTIRSTIIYISRKLQSYLPADSRNQSCVTALRFLLSFISQHPARRKGFDRTPSKIRSYWVLGFFFLKSGRIKEIISLISCLCLELFLFNFFLFFFTRGYLWFDMVLIHYWNSHIYIYKYIYVYALLWFEGLNIFWLLHISKYTVLFCGLNSYGRGGEQIKKKAPPNKEAICSSATNKKVYFESLAWLGHPASSVCIYSTFKLRSETFLVGIA